MLGLRRSNLHCKTNKKRAFVNFNWNSGLTILFGSCIESVNDMPQNELLSADMKVLMNHIYEYKKGVRQMVLYTFNRKYEQQAIARLEHQNIDYLIIPVGKDNLNLFFGRRECLDAIRLMVNRPLNQLSPEEDFILGAMLGYDICRQCERYCERKGRDYKMAQ